MAKYKHLSINERTIIEQGLKKGISLKAIAKELKRNCSTVSKEVKRNSYAKRTGSFGSAFNACKLRFSCKKYYICDNPDCKKNFCSYCKLCNFVCESFKEELCSKLDSPPYVCNGCVSRRNCSLKKRLYSSSKAQSSYELLRREARSGIVLEEDELTRLDKLISPLLLKGQSIHHICVSHKDEIMLDEKTIYNYVASGLFNARNIDLARKVRRKPRKKATSTYKVDKLCRVSRTLDDFNAFVDADSAVVQMDTVEGTKGGKVLLTLHFVQHQFMLAFLRDSNTAKSVDDIFDHLQNLLGSKTFRRLFPVFLCDNGSEFSNPKALEFDKSGERRTFVFYCDPYSSWQKGALENNHEFIRKVLPKGTSFDKLTQKDINLLMSHINSYGRKKLNDRPPHHSFSFFFGQDILDKLEIAFVPRDEINLTPDLLR